MCFPVKKYFTYLRISDKVEYERRAYYSWFPFYTWEIKE